MAEPTVVNPPEKVNSKACSRCGKVKALTCFYPDKKSRYQSYCKECKKKESRQYYAENREKCLQKSVEYRRNHPARSREIYRKYYKEYYATNKEKLSEYHKKYRAAHKEEIREYKKSCREINRDKRRAYDRKYQRTEKGKWVNRKSCSKRRAKERGSREIEGVDLKEVLERDNYRCQHCGRKTRSNYHQNHSLYPNVDHIVPLRLNGSHTKENMQCLCHQCNMKKGSNGTGDQLRMFG